MSMDFATAVTDALLMSRVDLAVFRQARNCHIYARRDFYSARIFGVRATQNPRIKL
jgi:hypothetical protein